MATFRKRSGKWQVQVRRLGHPPVSRSFTKRAGAEIWARQTEAEMERGQLPTPSAKARKLTLGEVLTRYRDEITLTKRGKEIERLRLNNLVAHPISRYALANVSPAMVARYRDERLAAVKPETVRRELTILRHAFEVARRDWGIHGSGNPVRDISKPMPSRPRERRLTADEFTKLIAACARSRSKFLEPAIRLAIETGMRRSELLKARWSEIDLEKRLMRIPDTKNGSPRTIPLPTGAIGVLNRPSRSGDRVLPTTPNAIRLAWEHLRGRAGLSDLHFHDLRHEAISRFFEKGLSVPEVALISGHKDVRQLFRYTHLRPESLVAKLG